MTREQTTAMDTSDMYDLDARINKDAEVWDELERSDSNKNQETDKASNE